MRSMLPTQPRSTPIPRIPERLAGVPALCALVLCALVLCTGLAGCVSLTGEDPTKRTLGTFLDDEAVERLALRRIKAADERLAASHINVVCFSGVVLITGQVEEDALRAKAENALEGIRKVRKIYNDIQVGGASSLVSRTNDRWLTTKVRSHLVAAENVPSSRIKIVTEDSVVYLLGVLPRAQADAAADVTRTVFGVSKVVKVFDYL